MSLIEAAQPGGPSAAAISSQPTQSHPQGAPQAFAQKLRDCIGEPAIESAAKRLAEPSSNPSTKAKEASAGEPEATGDRVNKRRSSLGQRNQKVQGTATVVAAEPDVAQLPNSAPVVQAAAVSLQPQIPLDANAAQSQKAVAAEPLATSVTNIRSKETEKSRGLMEGQPGSLPMALPVAATVAGAAQTVKKDEPVPLDLERVSSLVPAAMHGAGITHGAGMEMVATTPLPHSFAAAREPRAMFSASTPASSSLPASPEEARTFVASPNVLEIGLSAGSHGWLRVRAELGSGGEVSAQVTAASSAAAEHLGKEVPAIQAYLAGEQVGLSALVVNAAPGAAGAYDASASGAGGTGDHARQQSPDRQADASNLAAESHQEGLSFDFGLSGASLPAALFHGGASGGWLSVRV